MFISPVRASHSLKGVRESGDFFPAFFTCVCVWQSRQTVFLAARTASVIGGGARAGFLCDLSPAWETVHAHWRCRGVAQCSIPSLFYLRIEVLHT